MTLKLALAIWVVIIMVLSALALVGPKSWTENICAGLVVFHLVALYFGVMAVILAWGMGLI